MKKPKSRPLSRYNLGKSCLFCGKPATVEMFFKKGKRQASIPICDGNLCDSSASKQAKELVDCAPSS